MRELTLHLLDIAENGVSAGAQNITITIVEDLRTDRLKLAVEDDGRGMDAAMVEQVTNPFITTRTTRKVGLGIPLLKLAAEMCEGGLTVESTPNVGTNDQRRNFSAATSIGCRWAMWPARCCRCWSVGRRSTGCCAIAWMTKSLCLTMRPSRKCWAICR